MYKLDHVPTQKEIDKFVKHHKTHYCDYCRVWFADGTTRVYYNTEPNLLYCYDRQKTEVIVDFRNPIIGKDRAFGNMGIIRSKRVIRPLTKA